MFVFIILSYFLPSHLAVQVGTSCLLWAILAFRFQIYVHVLCVANRVWAVILLTSDLKLLQRDIYLVGQAIRKIRRSGFAPPYS